MGNSCSPAQSQKNFHIKSIEDLKFTDIDRAWSVVENEMAKIKGAKKAVRVKRAGWKTVRIFVSSTFRDFDAEREILVKKVFPDLRDWCQSRRLNLVEIDLRWGVPKDATSESTLRTCLGEIDRCYSENLMPFFVNMTSERIGWIPLGEQIPDALKKEYRWIDGMSVTEMEIMHGAYRIDNPNALFMIRDSSFLSTVPEDQLHHFVDENSIANYKLDKLKQRISQKFKEGSRVYSYSCEYAGIDKDTKMPRFKGLDDNFAPRVLEFFKERVEDQYPVIDMKKEDPYEEAKVQHDSFMKMSSERVVGRDELIDEFVHSYVNKTLGVSPVVIYGGPGLGKTSIMAALADRCQTMSLQHKLPSPTTARRWRVFYHFVGAVAGSTDQLAMLTRLLIEIKALKRDMKRPTSLDEAMGLVRAALSNPRTKNSIIIVDAINQFDDHRGMPAPISWLPAKMSQSIRLFFSLTPESSQFKNVKESGEGWTLLQLQPLDRATKESMVTANLARYNKRLDRGQLELLLNKRSSDNPMWLSLAAEELRIFGRFRELTNKIGALPDSLADLEADILGRFEREGDGRRLVATLCLLECSVHGLLENELLELLADPKLLPPSLNEKIAASRTYELNENETTEEQGVIINVSNIKQDRLTASQWADIYRVLRPFMRPFGASGEGRLDFYHRSLSKAVRNRYYYKTEKGTDGKIVQLEKNEDIVKWFHQKLADYFSAKCKHLERRVEEYPTHAYRCGDVKGLKDFLCDWSVFELMYDPEFSRELSQAWEHVFFLSSGRRAAKAGEENSRPKTSREQREVFRIMEKTYMAIMLKDFEMVDSMDAEAKGKLIQRMESVSRVLYQNGRFDSAFELSEKLIGLLYPSVQKCNLGAASDVLLSERDFTKAGENLPAEDRLKYAKLIHLQASIYDEEMKQVDYMYASHMPKILIIIESLECVIAILRALAPDNILLGRSLNRCSFFYSGIEHRGGHPILPRQQCKVKSIEHIESAIGFYAGKKNQEISLADCFITRGVVVQTAEQEQIDYYMKGMNLILENAGQYHPLLDRCYLNIGIYHEEAGDRNMAYKYFRKWFDILVEMFGRNHPKTQRAVRTLNEAAYYRIGQSLGHEIPQEGVHDEEGHAEAAQIPDDEIGDNEEDTDDETEEEEEQEDDNGDNA